MQKVLHETCQQYVARRLSEGWRIVSQRGYHLILSSPDGNILRPVDLRNDIATLRPNSDEAIGLPYPTAPNDHYTEVDEVTPDEATTKVWTAWRDTGWYRDLYGLPELPPASAVASIKIYFRVWRTDSFGHYAQPSLKSNTTITDGNTVNVTNSWITHSQQWNTNPAGGAWTKADIDALQIGIRMRSFDNKNTQCTQVYVEVDYTPFVVTAPTVTTQDATGIGFD